MADISFKVEEGKFNYRVGCILTDGTRLLVMRDEGTEGYYLPGGRIHFGEKAADAAVREMQEELGAAVRPVRLLWAKEGFFTEFSSGKRCHGEVQQHFATHGCRHTAKTQQKRTDASHRFFFVYDGVCRISLRFGRCRWCRSWRTHRYLQGCG